MNAKQRRKFVREKTPIAITKLVAHKLSGTAHNDRFRDAAIRTLTGHNHSAGWRFHMINETLKAFK